MPQSLPHAVDFVQVGQMSVSPSQGWFCQSSELAIGNAGRGGILGTGELNNTTGCGFFELSCFQYLVGWSHGLEVT
ncbi:MAG: hypothetical protein IPJ88_09820 [Myxococcales bacterium]|nr:MAG: hypothetical protein IPJ88_09820 [Myxococcales bacterium]